MPIKVGMVSLGCSKNQVDSEIMLSLLKKGGYELCADSGLCDVVIVNTCGFIEDAKKESIENILEFCTLKKEGRIKVIVVTGCLAERYREEVAKEIPEADVVLGIGKNSEIVEAIGRALNGERVVEFGDKYDLPLSGERIISNLPFFAYLKVADGCSNRCTYCAIPSIRGDFRSRGMEDILAEARWMAEGGVKEINVVAQDTSRYGEDLCGKPMLPELLRKLCKIDGIKWIRLLYLYPDRISDELIDVIAKEDKIVKYMDIPLQHCSGEVLRRMNRRGDRGTLTALLQKIRARIPGVVLRTTLICGFPGETKEQFEELCEFVDEIRFERLGCFAYSAEEGTPAASMEGQLDESEKLHRCEIVMEQQMGHAERFNERMIGKVLEVAVEGYDRYAESYFGRSYMDAPDIDTKTFFTSEHPLSIGDFVQVKVEDTIDYDLMGSLVE
ncbi:30S ribosomal protein S12 methylthiotransferase RimO [Harryflintia acetispora]|uniref:Ribosomal protein uS12 methylthiotransferase RimO n=1 Tax=Harryflintia acetispora TaxID=1849041 RepID=A0A9X8Y8H8_9FIRM|nr:30S ribosomal protein S12 methylthiotransferase RimO [Harryflintia acetispora]TCL43830.1 ribosomal protein S12 methylthiotransferase [Harryflintia acetispora]